MNDNKFLTLLMGECWHELIPYCDTKGMFKCKTCGIEKSIAEFWNPNPDHLSNPLPVIKWIEQNMPEVWTEYVDSKFVLFRYDKKEAYECLNSVLNLSNLVTYLSEHREWGEIPCSQFGSRYCMIECNNEKCEGTSYIKHPALIYLEQEEEV